MAAPRTQSVQGQTWSKANVRDTVFSLKESPVSSPQTWRAQRLMEKEQLLPLPSTCSDGGGRAPAFNMSTIKW